MSEDPDAARKSAYANLIVTYWWHEYLVGVVRQEELLENFTYFFDGPVGRNYWSRTRSYWTSTTITHGKAFDRQRHTFAAVADAAYAAVTPAPPGTPSVQEPSTADSQAHSDGEGGGGV